MTDIELLQRVIDASGLSLKNWAQLVAWRDQRTVRRWLDGDNPIPELVRDNLAAIDQRIALGSP